MLCIYKSIGKNGKIRYSISPYAPGLHVYFGMTFRTLEKACNAARKVNPDIVKGGVIAIWADN